MLVVFFVLVKGRVRRKKGKKVEKKKGKRMRKEKERNLKLGPHSIRAFVVSTETSPSSPIKKKRKKSGFDEKRRN